MGLWLSAPAVQESWAVVSVISSTVTFCGGPGEPEEKDADSGGQAMMSHLSAQAQMVGRSGCSPSADPNFKAT